MPLTTSGRPPRGSHGSASRDAPRRVAASATSARQQVLGSEAARPRPRRPRAMRAARRQSRRTRARGARPSRRGRRRPRTARRPPAAPREDLGELTVDGAKTPTGRASTPAASGSATVTPHLQQVREGHDRVGAGRPRARCPRPSPVACPAGTGSAASPRCALGVVVGAAPPQVPVQGDEVESPPGAGSPTPAWRPPSASGRRRRRRSRRWSCSPRRGRDRACRASSRGRSAPTSAAARTRPCERLASSRAQPPNGPRGRRGRARPRSRTDRRRRRPGPEPQLGGGVEAPELAERAAAARSGPGTPRAGRRVRRGRARGHVAGAIARARSRAPRRSPRRRPS